MVSIIVSKSDLLIFELVTNALENDLVLIIPSLHNLNSNLLTLFRMGQEKRFYASFSPVIPTNIGISPQNFLTFNFNLFVILV